MTSLRNPSQRPVHYGWVVLSLIVMTVFGALGLARHGYTSVLPAMQKSLQLTHTQTGELQSWNLLGYLLTVVFAGLLATRYGPRVVIGVALAVAGCAMVLTGLIPTFHGASLGRFLAGAGGAGANVPAMGLVSAWFGARRRGLAAGVAVAGSSLGLILTGPMVPFLLARLGPEGWRVCWYLLGALALAAGLLAALFLRNRPAELGLLPLGQTEFERSRPDQAPGTASLEWSLVWRSRALWHLAAIYFAFGFSYIIYSTFFIRYLVGEAAFASTRAGWLWLQVGLVSVVSGFVWGVISDRRGRRFALLWVFILQGTSFLVFGAGRSAGLIYVSAALFAVTAWSIPALMAALAGDLFGGRLAPAALGLITIVFGLGQAMGPYLAGRIADATHSFSTAFLIAGVVSLLLGAGGSSLLPRDGTVHTPPAQT